MSVVSGLINSCEIVFAYFTYTNNNVLIDTMEVNCRCYHGFDSYFAAGLFSIVMA
jgi:hypothetical protein